MYALITEAQKESRSLPNLPNLPLLNPRDLITPTTRSEVSLLVNFQRTSPSLPTIFSPQLNGVDVSSFFVGKKKKLPEEATQILRNWIVVHSEYPYPTDAERMELIKSTGLNSTQVNNWLTNARRRFLNRPADRSTPHKRKALKSRHLREQMECLSKRMKNIQKELKILEGSKHSQLIPSQ